MVEQYYSELQKKQNIRENLSLLKNEIKNPIEKEKLLELVGDGAFLTEFLKEAEPKVRKNAALLLGDLGIGQAAEQLFAAYQSENTLFVRSSYLTALGKLDAAQYLEPLKQRLAELTATEPAENEKKHIREEIRELEKIITGIEGITRHTWRGFETEHDFVLTTNRELRNVTAAEVGELPITVRRKVAQHPLGVLVRTKDWKPFTRLRTYREMLFPLAPKTKIENDPKKAAECIWNSELMALLREVHEQEAPFYFRLEQKGRMDLETKSQFAKKFAAELETLSGRQLINSTQNYEIEIRLVETKDGTFAAFVKLFTIPMKRFSYRKHAVSTSIHPAAAMLVELAKPYLKENAQILDPFCGVGTMLIERDIKVPAREKYGIDIFADAVKLARENTVAAGEQIHYINRDYFDFKHAYLFDEIITNMPVRGKKSKEEMDDFYGAFFTKSKTILADGGRMILYTNEEGFVKKQLRLNAEYRLVQEHCVREREHFYLYVIEFKKR